MNFCGINGGKIMLTTNLKLADKYNYLSEKFTKAYHFLRTEDLEALPVGITEIDGNEVFANVQEYTTMPWEECAFEAHDRYFDIQYMVYGREMFGYVKREGLKEKAPYDQEKDLVFFEDPRDSGQILLEAGDLAVVPPEDAHKPRCMAGESCRVKKIVVKVKR